MQSCQQGSRIVFGTGNKNFTVFRSLRVLDMKVISTLANHSILGWPSSEGSSGDEKHERSRTSPRPWGRSSYTKVCKEHYNIYVWLCPCFVCDRDKNKNLFVAKTSTLPICIYGKLSPTKSSLLKWFLSNSSLRPRTRSWLYFPPTQQNHVNPLTKPRQPCNITTSTL